MRNFISFAGICLRINNKNLANWGFSRLRVGPLSFGSRTNGGDYCLISYQKHNECWRWAVYVTSRAYPVGRSKRRKGQWHDYYWLPFGRRLIVSQQDFHKPPVLPAP
jgi:predicted metalloenzyme YecM